MTGQNVLGPPRLPSRIAVIGGGRWARTLARVLCEIAPRSADLSIHSRRGSAAVASWVAQHGLGPRLRAETSWPDDLPEGTSAVVVANAAGDHAGAARWALARGASVLVEKPLATSGADARGLVDTARSRGSLLSAAQVFLFARYVTNLAEAARDCGPPRRVEVVWEDPPRELRHGEPKRYDPSLPVFRDCLPHALAIAATMSGEVPTMPDAVRALHGGALVEVEATGRSVRMGFRVGRNRPARRRVLRCAGEGGESELDFSVEPGVIRVRAGTLDADPRWETAPRPVASMLTAFLVAAAGGEVDARLDPSIGVAACHFSDAVAPAYRRLVMGWLSRLEAGAGMTDDVRYALTELLQAGARLSAVELERELEVATARLRAGLPISRWLGSRPAESVGRTADRPAN